MKHKRFNLFSVFVQQSALDQQPDPKHFHRRRFTHRYQSKKKVLYHCWLAALFSMLLNPVMAYAVAVSLFMTFFSFFVLDETT